jgi:heat shock protein HslJ
MSAAYVGGAAPGPVFHAAWDDPSAIASQGGIDMEGQMLRNVLVRGLLCAALVVTLATPAAGQADVPTLEGTEWHLVSYAIDGEREETPWYLSPRLTLRAGQAVGVAGCNELYSTYELDGSLLTIGEPATTDIGCGGEPLLMETGYLEALPTAVRWTIQTVPDGISTLTLYDAAGDVALAFQDSAPIPTPADLRSLGNQVASQQTQIDRLTRQVAGLRERVEDLEGKSS